MAWHGIGGWAHRSWVEVHRMVMTGRQDIAPIETIPLPLTPTATSSSVASVVCSVFVTVGIIVIIVTLASSTLIIPGGGGGGGGGGGAVGSPGVRVASHRPAAAAAAASAFARGQRVDTALCSTSA